MLGTILDDDDQDFYNLIIDKIHENFPYRILEGVESALNLIEMKSFIYSFQRGYERRTSFVALSKEINKYDLSIEFYQQCLSDPLSDDVKQIENPKNILNPTIVDFERYNFRENVLWPLTYLVNSGKYAVQRGRGAQKKKSDETESGYKNTTSISDLKIAKSMILVFEYFKKLEIEIKKNDEDFNSSKCEDLLCDINNKYHELISIWKSDQIYEVEKIINELCKSHARLLKEYFEEKISYDDLRAKIFSVNSKEDSPKERRLKMLGLIASSLFDDSFTSPEVLLKRFISEKKDIKPVAIKEGEVIAPKFYIGDDELSYDFLFANISRLDWHEVFQCQKSPNLINMFCSRCLDDDFSDLMAKDFFDLMTNDFVDITSFENNVWIIIDRLKVIAKNIFSIEDEIHLLATCLLFNFDYKKILSIKD